MSTPKKENVNVKEIVKVDKIEFKGEVTLNERINEDTGEKRYNVQITIDNPFADLFEGGSAVESNKKLVLSFKESQAKKKAQFNFKAKQALATCEKIDISGFISRKKFFDRNNYRHIKYIAIFINNPFEDGLLSLTVLRADVLGLVEMFANEQLKDIA